MKLNLFSRWLYLTILSLIFVGCGDSQDYVFTNTNNSGGGTPSRQILLQFDYADVLAQMPAAVAGYRVEALSTTGEQLSQRSVSGRVPEVTLSGVTTQAFVLRLVGLDTNGNPLGFADLSVPAGTESVTLRIDVLLSGTPATGSYTQPNGQPSRLAFLVHPRDGETDEPFSVSVVALDAAGYRTGNVSGSVSLTLTGSGELSGTNTANFSDGVATFTGLTINSPGSGKFLTATSTGLTSAQSLNFSLVSNDPPEPVIQVPIAPEAARSDTPVITSDSNGNFVVLWLDDTTQVMGRRLTPEGQPVGEAFVVDGEGTDIFPYDVAKLPNGGFVAAWKDQEVQVQRFDANNSPLGTAVTLTGNTSRVKVASSADGRYIVTYSNGSRVFAQRFNADGTANGPVIDVNSFLVHDLAFGHHSDIGCDEDGNFVITWAQNLDGFSSIAARVFNQDGTPQAAKFIVAQGTGGSAIFTNPTVDMSPDGRFVIAYEFLTQSEEHWEIRLKTFTAAGISSNEMTIPSTVSHKSFTVDVAMQDDGTFAISWNRDVSPRDQIWLARFSADGTLQGSEVRAGEADIDESSSRVAFAPDGTFAVVWNGRNGLLLNAYYSGFPVGSP